MPTTLGEALRQSLEERRGKNRSYSLRAFARDLDVSHSYLSLLLREKRRPSLARVAALARRLRWSAEQQARFALGAAVPAAKRKSPARYRTAERDQYRILAEWWHLPILDLTTLDDFDADPRSIADRIGLSPARVRQSLHLLERLDLVDKDQRKKTGRVFFPGESQRALLRRYHARMIGRALKELRSGKQNRRDITAMTFAACPEKIDAAREMVRRFRRRLRAFLADGRCTELYQLNVQLFPLTSRKR